MTLSQVCEQPPLELAHGVPQLTARLRPYLKEAALCEVATEHLLSAEVPTSSPGT